MPHKSTTIRNNDIFIRDKENVILINRIRVSYMKIYVFMLGKLIFIAGTPGGCNCIYTTKGKMTSETARFEIMDDINQNLRGI